MHTVSEEYKRIIKGVHSFRVRLKIDYDKHPNDNKYIFGMDKIFDLKTQRQILTDDMAIGLTPSGEIDFTIVKPKNIEFSRMAKIVPEVAIVREDGTVLDEWIQKGEYFIDVRETIITDIEVVGESGQIERENRLHIIGYDAMLRTGREYPSTGTAYEKSGMVYAYNVVEDICEICGIALNNDSKTELRKKSYEIKPKPTDYTLRETLGFIGVMYGGNFAINDSGEMTFYPIYSLMNEVST